MVKLIHLKQEDRNLYWELIFC